eukprot:11200890-Lingulodinium_polyedra.AAC.1
MAGCPARLCLFKDALNGGAIHPGNDHNRGLVPAERGNAIPTNGYGFGCCGGPNAYGEQFFR